MINVVGGDPLTNQPSPASSGSGVDQNQPVTQPTTPDPTPNPSLEATQAPEQPAQEGNAPAGGQPPKKKSRFSPKQIIAGVVLLILIVGGGIGLYLNQRSQDIRQQASSIKCYSNAQCPSGFRCSPGGIGSICVQTQDKVDRPSATCREECISAGNTPSECNGLPACKKDAPTTTQTPTAPDYECRSDADCGGLEVCNNRGMCEMQKPTTPAGSTGGNVSNQAECSEDADCGKGEICKGTSCVAGSPAAPKTSSGGSTSLASINENNDGGDDNNEQSQSCTEQCPGSDGVLRNCTPPEADGTAQESLCNSAGRTESCGGATYCCPSAGGAWTTDMSACSTDGGDDGDDNSQTIADSGSSSNNNSSSNGQNNVTLPSTLPQSGPAEWLKFLQIGLGALGIGALLLLFL